MRQDKIRLETLRRLMLLDSQPEQEYDAIPERLTQVLGVPVAMINLLDEGRDWFKACIGLPLRESPASTSFCESILTAEDDLIVVEDTLADERFRAHPLVVGEPFVRFYAGARLVVEDQTVGTLCAFDFVPRRIEPQPLYEMQMLASAVVKMLLARL
jgi:GAF domain-containing protein